MGAPDLSEASRLAPTNLGLYYLRTVYTPESDAQFALFLVRLRTYVDYSIDADLRPTPFMPPSTEPPFDNGPNEEMKRRFVNDVVEGPNLDGADTDAVRNAFVKWLEGEGVDMRLHQLYARHRVCIMVDKAVLNSVAAAPKDPSEDHELDSVWVKAVECLAPGESEWQAWLKVGLNAIEYFWFNVFAGEEIEDMFTAMMEDGEEAFTG
ncbi:hypothetical protein BKA61DRAFT_585525 [Leptodontidium sp. MPI-SDFR-AT-0119]|nr:hypothetical protein BKA61DRAFT_585525 [Leptodontidium sp. MPI-SDFR-AT-0119]